MATDRRIDNNRHSPELLDAGDGRNRSQDKIQALVQLTNYCDVLVLVGAVVEGIVNRRGQNVVFAVKEGSESRRAVGSLVVNGVEAILCEEARLVRNGVCGRC